MLPDRDNMPEATALPPSIILSSLPSHGLSRGAHPLRNILVQFMQSDSLIKLKSTLVFNVSACMESSATVSRPDAMD